MSMRDNPGSGHVFLATELIACLPHEQQVKATELCDELDCAGMMGLLEQHLPAILPRPSETFVFGDEDTSDDLEAGNLYVLFDEADLYVKTEKPEMAAFLKCVGKKPEYCRWGIWG